MGKTGRQADMTPLGRQHPQAAVALVSRRAALPLLATSLLAACSTTPAPTPRGKVKGPQATGQELLQSDINRVATIAMRENLDALYRLADKLYRRNPAEWRKGNAPNRTEAVNLLRSCVEQRFGWPPLQERRDIDALALALSPEFADDRVGSFIYAVADTMIVAHGDRTQFFLIDSLDAQHLYNAARNVEVAIWILAQRRNALGRPLLLADEINPAERNLSYEREFGKIIARLDLLAQVMTEKYRRAVISYVQTLVGGQLLQFLPVR